MKDWLKFISGSFFLDKYAKEGAKRGFVNVFLGFIMLFVFVLVSLYAGFKYSFPVHYKNSSQINRAVYNIFADENKRVSIKAVKNSVVSGLDGVYDNSFVINTLKNEGDAQKYKSGELNVIFDTRPLKTTYDDFSAYAEEKNGGGKISYETYAELPDSAKSEYSFKIEYSGDALLFDEAKTDTYHRHLARTNDRNDKFYSAAVSAEYEALNLNKDNMSAEKYTNALYELYIKSYYPDLTGTELFGSVPTVRTWYVRNLLAKADAGEYLCIFDDEVAANFKTDAGVSVALNGYYLKMDGFELKGGSASELKTCADEFIMRSFEGADGLNLSIYFINMLQIFPVYILAVILLSVIFWVFCKVSKSSCGSNFAGAFKIVCSFILFASILTAILSVILSFSVSRNTAYGITILAFIFIMFARCIALIIAEAVRNKKIKSQN